MILPPDLRLRRATPYPPVKEHRTRAKCSLYDQQPGHNETDQSMPGCKVRGAMNRFVRDHRGSAEYDK